MIIKKVAAAPTQYLHHSCGAPCYFFGVQSMWGIVPRALAFRHWARCYPTWFMDFDYMHAVYYVHDCTYRPSQQAKFAFQ